MFGRCPVLYQDMTMNVDLYRCSTVRQLRCVLNIQVAQNSSVETASARSGHICIHNSSELTNDFVWLIQQCVTSICDEHFYQSCSS